MKRRRWTSILMMAGVLLMGLCLGLASLVFDLLKPSG